MEEIQQFIEIIKEPPKGCIYTAVSLYGFGGAVRDLPLESTAFAFRNAEAIVGIQTEWEEKEFKQINQKWLLEKFELIKPMTVGSFINFPLLELKDYKHEYFGDEVRQERLKAIKEQYDPHRVFSFPQGL